MNRALASVAIAATVICGSAAPAFAADNPINAKITGISSGSSQVSSPVTVKGAWSTKKLEVGQSFKVTSDVINWAYDFPFTLNDDTKIGSCKIRSPPRPIFPVFGGPPLAFRSLSSARSGVRSLSEVGPGPSPSVTRTGIAPVTTTATVVTTRTPSPRTRSGAGSIPTAPPLG